MIKQCNKCLKEKELKDFYKYKTGKYREGKLHNRCIECCKEAVRLWVAENRTKMNKYQYDYYHKKKNNV